MIGPIDTIREMFPRARITSGYRGPNHPLTRKNPRSYHAIGSPDDPRAIDVAPIPGVGFDDYVKRLRSGGMNIVEALDEARNPRKHTTGPNWHIALGDPMPAKPSMIGGANRQFPPVEAPEGLGGLFQDQLAYSPMSLPAAEDVQMSPKKGPLGLSKNQWAAMLAAAADSIRAHQGVPSNVLGGFMQSQDQEADRNFAREKLAEEIRARREAALAKANEPPQWLQDARTFSTLPPEERQRVISYRDAMYPVIADVQGPDGSVIRKQMPRSSGPMPGDRVDGYIFLGGDPNDQRNWRPQ